MAAAASDGSPTGFNLATAPNHHRKLLEVIATLHATLNTLPDTHFYVTGGAAAAYLLPAKGYPINDIDCVCVISPALDSATFTEKRNLAIRETKRIVKNLLEHLTSDEVGPLLAEIPDGGASLTKAPYRITPSNTNTYVPSAENAIAVAEISPFTGTEYYDDRIKTRVISIRHRIPPYGTGLLDISFPSRDYERIAVKWGERFSVRTILDITVPVLSMMDLLADQDYAAAHNDRPNKQARRTQRVANIRQRLASLPVIKTTWAANSAPLPPYRGKATTAPPVPITGGGSVGATTAMATPAMATPARIPVDVTIRQIKPGLVTLVDHRGKEEWRGVYDRSRGLFRFEFMGGFYGNPSDNFWFHDSTRKFYPYPPPSA